jgi:hypothetical protein
MERSTEWERSRWVALACVIALHVSIIVVLARVQVQHSVEPLYLPLLILPSITGPVEPPADRRSSKRNARALPVSTDVPPATPLSPSGIPSVQQQAPIDWAEEAKQAAIALTGKDSRSTATPTPFASGVSGTNSWFPSPAHRAGDQYTDASGERVVWISDTCYQVSGSSLLTVPELFSKAMLPKTICPSNSRKPRGDLFKDLSAYKKYHPEE